MSMTIDSYANSLLNTYAQQNSSTSKIENTLSKDLSTSTDEEMMEVCKEFEAYFVEQVFKAMKKMVPEEEESTSGVSTLDYFEDMLTQEYAKSATEGQGLGLAQMLYESMKRNQL